MIHYDDYLNYFNHAADVTMCVTVPLYLLHVFKLGAMDDKEKFRKYITEPFGLEKVAFTTDDLSDELAELLVTEGYYYKFAGNYRMGRMDHGVKDIFEKDIQLYYGLTVEKQMAYDEDIEAVAFPCIPSYAKAIDALREIYCVDISAESMETSWLNFFINYASYAIEAIATAMVWDTDQTQKADRAVMGRKMIHSAVKGLLGSSAHFGGQHSTHAMRMFMDNYDVDNLYKYLSDHVFRTVPSRPQDDPDGLVTRSIITHNCTVAGRLMMAFFTMEIFPNCDYDTVCATFLKDDLTPDDYAIYNTKQDIRTPDLSSDSLMILDTISSYYFSILCPEIVLSHGQRAGVTELKTYMFNPLAYLTTTSLLREVGFVSGNAKSALVTALKDPACQAYPQAYTLCEYLADNALIVTGDVDSTMTPVHAAWNFAEFLRTYWTSVPLPYKYIIVNNFLVEVVSNKSAGDLINSTEKFFVTYRQIIDATDKISESINDVSDDVARDTKGFEAALKEAMISKYGSLNAASYVSKVSSEFVDFVNELVMTRIMY